MQRQRYTCNEAVDAARRLGVRTKRMKDGHWLFFLPGPRTVNVQNGRVNDFVPPRLALYLSRLERGVLPPPAPTHGQATPRPAPTTPSAGLCTRSR